jgi:hypothetical protein
MKYLGRSQVVRPRVLIPARSDHMAVLVEERREERVTSFARVLHLPDALGWQRVHYFATGLWSDLKGFPGAYKVPVLDTGGAQGHPDHGWRASND